MASDVANSAACCRGGTADEEAAVGVRGRDQRGGRTETTKTLAW